MTDKPLTGRSFRVALATVQFVAGVAFGILLGATNLAATSLAHGTWRIAAWVAAIGFDAWVVTLIGGGGKPRWGKGRRRG